MHSCKKGEGEELNLALHSLADPDRPQPPGCFIYEHLWTATRNSSLHVPGWCFLWLSLWGCGGASTLLQNHKHNGGLEEASRPCTSIISAPCHPEAKQHRALVRIWLSPGIPLPFPEGPLRCSVDGQSHSHAPSPSAIHRTPREQALGMLQQASLPTSF